jgi:hypothetical protein
MYVSLGFQKVIKIFFVYSVRYKERLLTVLYIVILIVVNFLTICV